MNANTNSIYADSFHSRCVTAGATIYKRAVARLADAGTDRWARYLELAVTAEVATVEWLRMLGEADSLRGEWATQAESTRTLADLSHDLLNTAVSESALCATYAILSESSEYRVR